MRAKPSFARYPHVVFFCGREGRAHAAAPRLDPPLHARTHARTHTHTHTHTYLKYRRCRLSCLPFVFHFTLFHCDTRAHAHTHSHIPPRGMGTFFCSCRQLYLSSFSDTHTHTHTHTHTVGKFLTPLWCFILFCSLAPSVRSVFRSGYQRLRLHLANHTASQPPKQR